MLQTDSAKVHWIAELDYLRGLAILAVIGIHTSAGFTAIKDINLISAINIYIDSSLQFAVPLFIFISGFALSQKYYENISIIKFYCRRFWSVIPPYLIFSLIYIMFSAISNNTCPNIMTVSEKLATASSAGHLQYFIYLLQLYLIYPILIWIYRTINRENKFIASILIISFVFLSWIPTLIWNHLNAIYPAGSLIGIFIHAVAIPYVLFYFILGICVGRDYIFWVDVLGRMQVYTVLFIFLILGILNAIYWIRGFYSTFYNGCAFFAIPEAIHPLADPVLGTSLYLISFILSFKIAQYLIVKKRSHISEIVLSLGKYSFGIYLVHVLFMYFIGIVFNHWGITAENAIFYPILFVLTVCLSYLFIYLASLLPHSEIIIGMSPSRKD